MHVTIAYDSYIDSGDKSLAFLEQQEPNSTTTPKNN
jgi:hypothetical protein